ncbi:MAG: glycosyltransferase family 39 protein [Patescibacteria group bacterium]|nr:glycosyltransferase family 39 protein [Patescibacteria group bacterium]MDE2591222.1 glycosyltransferase family 39 protein [Patescibacteria group bacterium]
MGETTDELYCPKVGFHYIQLLSKGDLLNKYWEEHPDPPAVCNLVYGFFGQFDVKGFTKNHEPIFTYDHDVTRLVSVTASSLAVVFLALFGWEYISPFVGVSGALIFSIIPTYLGLSQLVSQESLFILLYNSNLYFFMKFLSRPTGKRAFFTGVLFAIALMDKFTNVFLIPIFLLIAFVWYKVKKSSFSISRKHIFLILLGIGLSVVIIWPSLLLHLKGIYLYEKGLRFSEPSSPWEWFLGRPVHVPAIYFTVQFLVRTPVLLLLFFVLAIEFRPKRNDWKLFLLLIWFCIPFLQSFYHYQQQGIRYVSQVYAPFALIVAVGIEYLTTAFTKKPGYKLLVTLGVLLYLIFNLSKVSPYYLDYFNELVGGVKGVYKHQLFEIGWWGQGGKDAGDYIIAHAQPGSSVGYKLNPDFLIEFSDLLHYESFQKEKQYDFVVTNYAHYLKLDYNNPELLKDYDVIYHNYTLVHTTSVDSVPLYKVYKRKP